MTSKQLFQAGSRPSYWAREGRETEGDDMGGEMGGLDQQFSEQSGFNGKVKPELGLLAMITFPSLEKEQACGRTVAQEKQLRIL